MYKPEFLSCAALPRLGLFALLVATALSACTEPSDPGIIDTTPQRLTLSGASNVTDRYTAELWVRGDVGYTTTWGFRGTNAGNAIKIWDVSGNTPTIIDSIIVSPAGTLGDIQVTEDGGFLLVAVEHTPNGALMVYSLADPVRPALVTRFASPTGRGVHTAEIQRVNGTLHAFLAVNSGGGAPGHLAITSLANPAQPVVLNTSIQGNPFVHDVFVRDGILFVAMWNGGVGIFDIGGGNRSGSPANPVLMGSVVTTGGSVHNIWWFHNPVGSSKRYIFVGQEGPANLFTSSSGDIHVVDVSDMTQPREVAFYSVVGAGTHNFSMDEARGVLYAAYYNGGVRALDVRGDLSVCEASQKSPDGRCNLGLMGRELANSGVDGARPMFVWGVHYTGGKLYASDMLTGLWKFEPVEQD